MKQIKVAEATNIQLDWLVATCEGIEVRWSAPHEQLLMVGYAYLPFSPTSNWSQMGPIIEREGPWVRESAVASPAIAHLVTPDKKWFAYARSNHDGAASHCYYGETFLIAAARCFVSSKLGRIVEVPDEL